MIFFRKKNEHLNWKEQLEDMISTQIIQRGIDNKRVLDAFRKNPRHLFVPEKFKSSAYNDYPMPIGEGQTISQPYMVALMVELLNLKGSERVLEIGTGSGYQTAILATLAREVISIERIKLLADDSEPKLRNMGFRNITIITADGSKGYEQHAPYDAIIVSAAPEALPNKLPDQLKENGILVIPTGMRLHQTLYRITRQGNSFLKETICDCVFVPLIDETG